jgi:uncharacterized protein YkwD
MLRGALSISLALAAVVVAATRPASAAAPIARSLLTASAQSDLIALVNGYRASNGLQPVSSNGPLTAAATWMATDMAAKNYIGHLSSDGRSPTQRISAFGYPAASTYTGETLGAGYGTASAVLAGWQASAAHNAVLLNPNYNAVGIGLIYKPNATYEWYWAADFAGPGGTVKATAERAVAARRSSTTEGETVDLKAHPRVAQNALVETTARRITHFFAVLHRMGAI